MSAWAEATVQLKSKVNYGTFSSVHPFLECPVPQRAKHSGVKHWLELNPTTATSTEKYLSAGCARSRTVMRVAYLAARQKGCEYLRPALLPNDQRLRDADTRRRLSRRSICLV